MKRTAALSTIAGIVAIFVGIAVVALAFRFLGKQTPPEEESTSASVATTTQEGDQTIVKMDEEAVRRTGKQATTLPSAEYAPQVEAYGSLIEDPALSFTVRAPIAGIVRADPKHPFPAIGQRLAEDTTVGAVETRLAPLDISDRRGRLADSKASVEEMTAAAAASEAEYNRLKALNDQDKNVSDRAVEDGAAKMKGDQARLHAAQAAVTLLEKSIDGSHELPPVPLTTGQAGDVVEINARPGESIEAGQPVMRIARLDRLLARVTLAVGDQPDPAATTARILVNGKESQALAGTLVPIVVAGADGKLGPSLVYAVDASAVRPRPGDPVVAHIPGIGEKLHGVIVPRAAVVRAFGKAWAYVELKPGEFAFRAVPTDRPTDAGYFVPTEGPDAGAFKPGEHVVTTGAQAILTEQLKSSYKGETGG